MIDHRSYAHNLSSCEIKAWKKFILFLNKCNDLILGVLLMIFIVPYIFLYLGRPISIVQVLMIYVVDSHLHAVYHNYVFGT